MESAKGEPVSYLLAKVKWELFHVTIPFSESDKNLISAGLAAEVLVSSKENDKNKISVVSYMFDTQF